MVTSYVSLELKHLGWVRMDFICNCSCEVLQYWYICVPVWRPPHTVNIKYRHYAWEIHSYATSRLDLAYLFWLRINGSIPICYFNPRPRRSGPLDPQAWKKCHSTLGIHISMLSIFDISKFFVLLQIMYLKKNPEVLFLAVDLNLGPKYPYSVIKAKKK